MSSILVLVAGTNDPSNSDTLADAFLAGAKAKGMTVEKLYIRDLDLEHFTLKHYDPKTNQGKDYQKLEAAVRKADGILFASPVWNFSVPAHFKNMLDRMGNFCLDETHSVGTLGGKPAFLIFTGGTPYAAWTGLQRRTVSHIPVSLRYFGMTVIGKHYEERSTLGRGKFGLVVDKRKGSLSAVRAKGERFAFIVDRYKKTGKLPVKEAFLKAFFQFGQKMKRRLGL
jgi:multimeric flavodoxin WrbA